MSGASSDDEIEMLVGTPRLFEEIDSTQVYVEFLL